MMRFINLILAIVILTGPALTQAADAPLTSQAAETPKNDADLEKRLELSKKLHKVMPVSVRQQIDLAIDDIAKRQPEAQREIFRSNMRNALNYQALEKISIDAMAETYTVEELQAQVDYYSLPQAKSINDKYEQYAQKVFPEITRMLDKAVMTSRTGNPGQ